MNFYVVSALPPSKPTGPVGYLIQRDWNDWFTWYTMFSLTVYDKTAKQIDLGHVKIGRAGMTEAQATTIIPENFSRLDDQYFSLGQSENYYETLSDLGIEIRDKVLIALRDCSYNLTIFDIYKHENVMLNSLLRDISADRVRQRMHRLANGNSVLTRYHFTYTFPVDENNYNDQPTLQFDVIPDSMPPTNVHVLIGRNGVGKTRCLDLLTRSLLGVTAPQGGSTGDLQHRAELTDSVNDNEQSLNSDVSAFAGVVSVSFSAFDPFKPVLAPKGMRYTYVGLKKYEDHLDHSTFDNTRIDQNLAVGVDKKLDFSLKTHPELAIEFVKSMEKCLVGVRFVKWKAALEKLEADPLFREADIASLGKSVDEGWQLKAGQMFMMLSSGHGIVLLTITRLVELVEERSLVVLDEPESHLHPPLLSAFVRALSDLLTERNAVAIIATHSPVILQEVPQSCAWVLSRSGRSSRADRPEIETFGENVGILTREIFGLEVTQSGFHQMLADAVTRSKGNYEAVLAYFDNQLGAEARATARALSLNYDPDLLFNEAE
jgi:ABC-type transport system involved in cytochrome c biogenesis ATPase subunit